MSEDKYLTKKEFEKFKENDFLHLDEKVDKLLGRVSWQNFLTTLITAVVVITAAIFG